MFKKDIFKWVSEPLLQFMLLGAVLFALDSWFSARQDDPRQVTVDDKRLDELIQVFTEGQGREPTASELNTMLVKWAQNEIMYREALQLGLDQGDEMMRSRLILKMHNVLFSRAAPESPSEAELELFFNVNRARYDKPAYYDFEQFLLTGMDNISEAESLASSLLDAGVPEDFMQGFRMYKRRPAANLNALFDRSGEAILLAAEVNHWVAVESGQGLHLSRITKVYESKPAELDNVRHRVVRDWKKYQGDLQIAQQTVEIAGKYDLSLDLSKENKSKIKLDNSLEEQFKKGLEKNLQPQLENSVTAR